MVVSGAGCADPAVEAQARRMAKMKINLFMRKNPALTC
jgi:hypothetical protein